METPRNIVIAIAFTLISSVALADRPALILQITVDQLRADMVWRNADRFGAGGYRYLLDEGTVYTDARFRHATTVTAVGHATLATGSSPRQHGIVANDWWDRGNRRVLNNVEDPSAPYVAGSQGEGPGRSPRNLIGSTFSDELVLASDGKSRAFGVSTKDRGAILLAGHRGEAYWYSIVTGDYVTTTWYARELPGWVRDWNARRPADSYSGQTWNLLGDAGDYFFADRDDRSYEVPRGGMGNRFPHRMSEADDPDFFKDLRYTPWADEMTLSFTLALLEAEEVGQRGHTDFLSISFSATDYIGHAFGPNSLEAEDNVLRLDRLLARLFSAVDEAVGLDNTLIVLSADHGVQVAPEYAAEHGLPSGRIGTNSMRDVLNTALAKRFDTQEALIAAFKKPSLYLDYAALERAGIARLAAESALAEEVLRLEGVSLALTRSQLLLDRGAPDTPFLQAVRNSFHPDRSGDVYVVTDPFWYFGSSPRGNAATHGTVHNSDRHVPLLFTGPGINKMTVHRRVAPRDVAPTLSAIMGVAPPSGSVGEVLAEVVP